MVLPISLHRQPCLLHLQSQRPGPCSFSVLRTLTSRHPSSSFSSTLRLRRMCLGGCWSSALLWSQRPFHPLYSPLREVVLANVSHLNRSWASKHFLKHSTQMAYGPWKLRESRGSMQFTCALVPQNLFSLLYLLVKVWGASFRFPSCRIERFRLLSFYLNNTLYLLFSLHNEMAMSKSINSLNSWAIVLNLSQVSRNSHLWSPFLFGLGVKILKFIMLLPY